MPLNLLGICCFDIRLKRVRILVVVYEVSQVEVFRFESLVVREVCCYFFWHCHGMMGNEALDGLLLKLKAGSGVERRISNEEIRF